MEQDQFQGMSRFSQPPAPADATVSDNPATTSDDVATEPATAEPVAATRRELYSLTVDGVASRLHSHGIDRDQRTIQRWCKSGKLKAIIDADFGDRYMVDPSSVDELLPRLVAEDEAKSRRHLTPSRRQDSDVATDAFTPRLVREKEEDEQLYQRDKTNDSVATDAPRRTTSDDSDEDVATLKKRVVELEEQTRTLEIDKAVREKYNLYLEENFSRLLSNHDETTLALGRAQQEIEQLKTLLPPGAGNTQNIPFEPNNLET